MLSNAIIQPTLPATDIGRAKKFYEEKLGFSPSDKSDVETLEYQCGGGTSFILYIRPDPPKAENTAAHFRVADLEAEVKELKGRGVVFEEYNYPQLKTVDSIATMGEIKGAWFKDSEGNILGLTQMG